MPIRPLDHGWRAAQSITSTVSCCSRSRSMSHSPCEKPVPRTSTTSWV
ncbi:Uncharacterised protein [Mycobacteroides abscessus subsp. abscessus]|nr:Uncharacterised protein [Mycobacteroides abscessus subsp. abscessus]